MPDYNCKNCQHFHQHYTVSQSKFHGCDCGHCVYPRLKTRKPDTKACKHFQARTAPAFYPQETVTRTYVFEL